MNWLDKLRALKDPSIEHIESCGAAGFAFDHWNEIMAVIEAVEALRKAMNDLSAALAALKAKVESP